MLVIGKNFYIWSWAKNGTVQQTKLYRRALFKRSTLSCKSDISHFLDSIAPLYAKAAFELSNQFINLLKNTPALSIFLFSH